MIEEPTILVEPDTETTLETPEENNNTPVDDPIFENVICVFGGKGGVGVSLLSISLAYLISKYLHKSVCLITSEKIVNGMFKVRLPKLSSTELKDVPLLAKLSGVTTVWSRPPINIMIKDEEILQPQVLNALANGIGNMGGYDIIIIDGEHVSSAGHKLFVVNQCIESWWGYEEVQDEISTLVYSQTQADADILNNNTDIFLPYSKDMNTWFNRGVWVFDNIVDEEIDYLKGVAELINRRGIGFIQFNNTTQSPNASSKQPEKNSFLSTIMSKLKPKKV